MQFSILLIFWALHAFGAVASPITGRATAAPTKSKIRYGPYTIPKVSEKHPLMDMTGMLSENYLNVKVPCKDCTYTYLKAELVYANGTIANYETGAYLHHLLMFGLPTTGINDMTIDDPMFAFQNWGSATALTLMMNPFYTVGNERIELNYPNTGVYLGPKQAVSMTIELANLLDVTNEVFIELTTEWLPGKPAGYMNLFMVPQDALKGRDAPLNQSSFYFESDPFTIPTDAKILDMYGHLHDGGINTELLINGKVVCDSAVKYADAAPSPRPAAEAAPHSHEAAPPSGGMAGMAGMGGSESGSRIVSFYECKNVGDVKKGDKLTTKGYYDFNKRAPGHSHGGKIDVMAISVAYMGVPFATK